MAEIGLKAIGDLLLTKKSGDISTIGGAIGCMSEMISKSARSEGAETTAGDILSIKGLLDGNIGGMSEMISDINKKMKDSMSFKDILEGMKEKKLSEVDIKDIIEKLTDALGEKLDSLGEKLDVLKEVQAGNVNWGSTKKTKDAVEKFKDMLNDKKKAAESRIGKLVAMLNELKAISLKELLLAPIKLKILDKIKDQIKKFSATLDFEALGKTKEFLKTAPEILNGIVNIYNISKKLNEKKIQKIYEVLGLVPGGAVPPTNSILGMMNAFKNLNSDDLEKAKKNMQLVSAFILAMGFGTTLLVLFTPSILLAFVLLKPLEWAFFGFKGNGGLVGLFNKFGEHKKEIEDGAEAILNFSIGIAALGAGLGLLFAFTKNIEVGQLLLIVGATAALGYTTYIFGQHKDDIEDGAIAIRVMGAGLLVYGLGLGVLFKLTEDITLGQILLITLSTALLGYVVYDCFGNIKEDVVNKGAKAVALLGVCLIPLGISMRLILGSVKGVKWGEFGMLAATIVLLGGVVFGLGALLDTGVGAVIFESGLAGIALLGAALIPFGIGLQAIKKAAKDINTDDIDKAAYTAKTLMSALVNSASNKDRRVARKNARTLKRIGKSLMYVANTVKEFNKVSKDSIDIMISSVTRIAKFFFAKEAKEGEDETLYSIVGGDMTRKQRKNGEKNADAIGEISDALYRIAYSLKMFNEVADGSITKMKNSITEIAKFFFGNDEGSLNKLAGGEGMTRRKRKKGERNADAIGKISEYLSNVANAMKTFNEIGPNSVSTMKTIINGIADYFFGAGEGSLAKKSINFFKKARANYNIDAIEMIAKQLKKISKSLKDFSSDNINGVVDSIDKIANVFFSKDAGWANPLKALFMRDSLIAVGQGLRKFGRKTKNLDVKNIEALTTASANIVNNVFAKWDNKYLTSATELSSSIITLISSFEKGGGKFRRNSRALSRLLSNIARPSFTTGVNGIANIGTTIDKINTIDVEKAAKLTEMFKSFARIGGGGVLSDINQRIQAFVEACGDLITALNGNTDAMNSEEETVTVKNEFGEEQTMTKSEAELMPKQMRILNVQDLAAAIAEELNSLSVDCDANINLQINNESGNEWRISRV